MKPDYATRFGTKKPGKAEKHVPEGHVPMETCPTCKGLGKIPKADDVKARALGRV